MHRIDGEGATPDLRFTEGNPITGVVPTVVTAGWLNDLQENVMIVLREGGITAVKGRDLDLWDAIKAGAIRLIQEAFQNFEYVQQGGNVTGTIKGGKFTLTAPAGPAIPATLTQSGGTVTGTINVLGGTFTLSGGGGTGGEGPAIPDGVVAIGSGTSIRAAEVPGVAAAVWDSVKPGLGVGNGAIGASGGNGDSCVFATIIEGQSLAGVQSGMIGAAYFSDPTSSGRFIQCATNVTPANIGGVLQFAVDLAGQLTATNTSIAAADYAEWFETADGAALPAGISVVLDGGKVRPARAGDRPRDIIGVTRPATAPGVIGNAAEHQWAGAYRLDAFGQPLFAPTHIESKDKKTGAITLTQVMARVPNPAYDPSRPYVPRSQRPEWVLVGLLGQIPVQAGQPVGDRWRLMRSSETVNLYFVR